MFDHCVALAAIRLADRLDGTDHSALIHDCLRWRKKSWSIPNPVAGVQLTEIGRPLDGPEGSSIWVVCHFLQFLDADFARAQYELARRQLGEITLGFGYAHEWPATWPGPADIDSGPIIPVSILARVRAGRRLSPRARFRMNDFSQHYQQPWTLPLPLPRTAR